MPRQPTTKRRGYYEELVRPREGVRSRIQAQPGTDVPARRNRLFGLWAAAQLGLPLGKEAEAYAKTVVAADFEAPGDGDIIEKVRTDLEQKGIAVTETALRTELERAASEARRQLAQS